MPSFRSFIQPAPMSMTPATRPEKMPTRRTHSQPAQASWVERSIDRQERSLLRTMYRWRMRSFARSRCQSIV